MIKKEPVSAEIAGSLQMMKEVNAKNKTGLTFKRFFTKSTISPYDELEWESRTCSITSEKGEIVFEQKDVEVPKSWSQLAANIAASKYFYGQLGTPERERSVRQLVGRVVDTIVHWGVRCDYFKTEEDARIYSDELTHILLNQKAAFNSPVWFNLGVKDRPQQASACFINSVEDTMISILDLAKTEGMLFRGGSGTGTNFSTLRSSREKLSGGGTSSGPLAFIKGLDTMSGSIKSGGKTRRAAKMNLLNIDHPDVADFIKCKAVEEKKAWALIDAGYNGSFNVPGGAYDSIGYQNANHSVRVTDEFMQASLDDGQWHTRYITTGKIADTYKARDLMKSIAESAWICGDPGMQYDTTINRWHTCKNTDRIHASNPCSEFVFLDNTSCNLSSVNLMKFQRTDGEFDVEAYKHTCRIMITAQEIVVDNASYPTERITQNSHEYRPLGLGYANLGALLMARGVAYDSEAGRALAAALTAIMTGEAYHQSAMIARDHGWPFPGYERNREPMLGVMRMHRAAVEDIDSKYVPAEIMQAARSAWDNALALGEVYGYRNAQATVLAPTGCLVGSSLIATDRGLVPLNTLGDPNGKRWQDISVFVHTDEGPQVATKFFINGVAMTRRIKTACGYEIQGTPEHRIKVLDAETGEMVWRRFAEIKEGDMVPLALNTLIRTPHTVTLPPFEEMYWTGDYDTGVPRTVTPKLAELVGYFMGDGSLHSKGLRFCVSQQDTDVVEHLSALIRDLFNLTAKVRLCQGYWEVTAQSVPLVLWWEACGFAKHKPQENHTGKGYLPHIPNAILYTNDPAVYTAFLRGLYEADGTVTGGVPCWSTVQSTFSQQVKTMLLALGYPTLTKIDQSGWGQSDLFVLRLRNISFNTQFLREIGFIGMRKHLLAKLPSESQSGKHDYIPLTADRFEELVPAGSSYRDAALLSYKRQGGIARNLAQKVCRAGNDTWLRQAMNFFYDRIVSNEDGGEQLTYDLSVPANVTYTAGGFISHNTIGFLLGCDTTGVEPDIAIVKYKSLVGGGVMKIVNNTVPAALKKLGYGERQINEIVNYIDQTGTIEGAPHVRPEHLPVFDCAFKPAKGTRSIHYMGHIKMMAAVQPFISGAISKTVNVPQEATVDEIMQTYIEGWRLGLKAIAIYRDGSKRTQPLNTASTTEAQKAQPAAETAPAFNPVRRKLPVERRAITHKFSIAGHEGYITVGMFDDGTPGEIFLVMAKEGSTISGLMDAFATAISMALQYGVPLKALIDKFSHVRFEPSGYTGNAQIPYAKSIMDYIFRWLALKFLPAEESALVGVVTPEGSTPKSLTENGHRTAEMPGAFQAQSDAPTCADCGSIMVRNGACYKCMNCGETSGCS